MEFLCKKSKYIPARAIYAAIALLSLAFMIITSENSGFWYDEFAQICFSGLEQSIIDSLLVVDPTPPLFNVLANIWYDVVPYGERWLLLLPQIAMVGAVYFSALWGEILGGKRTGIWTALLIGSSQMVIEQCGYEFRGYGFYLFFSAAVLFIHARLFEQPFDRNERLTRWFCVALIGLMYSHLFGALLVAALVLVDLGLVLCGRLSKRKLWSYVVAGAAFLPWVIYFFINAGQAAISASVSWMSAPTIWDVVKLGAYLCGNHILVCGLLFTGTVSIFVGVVKSVRTGGETTRWLPKVVPIVAFTFMVLTVFLYGNIRTGHESLWVKRYFTGVFPCCAAICALGVNQILQIVQARSRCVARILNIAVVVCVIPVFLFRTATGDTPLETYYHREVTQVLYEQPDIRNEGTIVLSTCTGYIDGWEEYYCEQKGQREGLDIRSIFEIDAEILMDYEVVYFEYNFWEENSRELEARRMIDVHYTLDKSWDDIRLVKYKKIR